MAKYHHNNAMGSLIELAVIPQGVPAMIPDVVLGAPGYTTIVLQAQNLNSEEADQAPLLVQIICGGGPDNDQEGITQLGAFLVAHGEFLRDHASDLSKS
jgi:hypothetical protein